MRLHIDSARRLGAIVVVVLIALGAPACGGDKGPDIISPSETYIPDFNRTWRNRANPNHTFNFNPNQAGVSGQLVPNSQESLDGNNNAIAGTFNGRNLTFTIARPGGTINVTGRFVTDNTIQLTLPNNVTINLDRDLS